MKSRWFAVQHDDPDPLGMDPQPHIYDLMPYVNFR